VTISVAVATATCFASQSVLAQGIAIIHDDETELTLKAYETPIYKAAGLDPNALRIYLVNDPSINAFAAEGQNIFVNTGIFMQLDKPNEVIGILAHETGHIAGGHLSRGSQAISKASIPMLVSMAAGIVAMVAGAGDLGMGLLMLGQQVAQAQFNAFSRAQEATADQMGQKYLRATHQSGRGMVEVFEKFADEEAMSAYHIDVWATDHPLSRERIASLEQISNASPYRDVKDSPESQHEFDMIKAKLIGFTAPVESVFNKYPPSDTSKPARYARAIVYMRKPDLKKALEEINSLVKEEPNNPYFNQVLGQIYVNMAKPNLGVAPLQHAVDLLPQGTEMRVELAAAQLATERPDLAQSAIDNLKAATAVNGDDVFAWYQMAQGYSLLNNEAMANLSTAERYYAAGVYPQAARFAALAQRKLKQGTPDWQRANDIMVVSASNAKQQQ
jgi:predicted Zn-dependent protease